MVFKQGRVAESIMDRHCAAPASPNVFSPLAPNDSAFAEEMGGFDASASRVMDE
jgi:hypothetical protein